MTLSEPIVYFESVPSTQDIAREKLTGIYWTSSQTAGRGRFDRLWHAELGASLAISFALPDYKSHPKPYLIGMWMGLAIAESFDLQIQWPNDLVIAGKKVAGILTEIIDQVPVVGIGLNLGPMNFPKDLAIRATSLSDEGRVIQSPADAFLQLVESLRQIPEVPETWALVEERWNGRDATPGKMFKTQSGKVGCALGLTSEGELRLNTTDGEVTVSVAEALWGAN